MAKSNYQFEKRQKELAKQKKQEEKRRRKLQVPDHGIAEQAPQSSDEQGSQSSDAEKTTD